LAKTLPVGCCTAAVLSQLTQVQLRTVVHPVKKNEDGYTRLERILTSFASPLFEEAGIDNFIVNTALG
jgi:hypothetical protein